MKDLDLLVQVGEVSPALVKHLSERGALIMVGEGCQNMAAAQIAQGVQLVVMPFTTIATFRLPSIRLPGCVLTFSAFVGPSVKPTESRLKMWAQRLDQHASYGSSDPEKTVFPADDKWVFMLGWHAVMSDLCIRVAQSLEESHLQMERDGFYAVLRAES